MDLSTYRMHLPVQNWGKNNVPPAMFRTSERYVYDMDSYFVPFTPHIHSIATWIPVGFIPEQA